ncbi:5-methyltetrahydropteroyltriglutamate--homocysteine methyltransferase [Limnochorda pilosa]|uniref:5-methyltetrahydropteroyltriglutamate--homocysteine methyltransferase n=1 Tax=Limnochorda pilosa TaxID=1555112 RepID=A0A0K2SLV8_LIMPI|nr:5-methyltetrahydropteroyltriglutamate--homocysteine S-methyltransferase [Limnochorda pilosa]BAS27809.1 5-methyltetrahydropteroyltriglutamate--homocysteine methyltransferase [Limnochorda pilosa]
MAVAGNLGFPRIGAGRELKRATEAYWKGELGEDALLAVGRELRLRHWGLQRDAGLGAIPSNDFSFYDQVLDMACVVGAVPERFGWEGGPVPLATAFAMARGVSGPTRGAGGEVRPGTEAGVAPSGVPAMEMTKWFDTNYHYIVPELHRGQRFELASKKPVDEFREAREAGFDTRPVLIGPVSLLLLGKARGGAFDRLSLLDTLLPVYQQLLAELREAGAAWVQVDEPFLALDPPPEGSLHDAYRRAYAALREAAGNLKLLVATYFEGLRENLETALALPVNGLHLDLVRAPEQLDQVLAHGVPEGLTLSLGVVDGRNVWRTDLAAALEPMERARKALGSHRLQVAPSCSLLHVPVDLSLETALDPELKGWLAFARQKLDEVAVLARALNEGRDAVRTALEASRSQVEARRSSARRENPQVQARLVSLTSEQARRRSPHTERRSAQQARLGLPPFPTTTIGSFPQTGGIRRLRARLRRGELDEAAYETAIKAEIERVVRLQEGLGLDVLVHGEPERNDMVEYFGEQLEGFAFTEHGWVQSYGSRYVKPPIIYGDVWRPAPMTVRWITYAQSLTDRPVKGMLTGPVTILQWSFVRDDQPRSETCRQIALAIRDEVLDLEAAGIGVIQIDEPAFREGLPLRRADWAGYLRWASESFRLATAGVRDETQIHTHMCYSEFNDIIDAIAGLDADVISIEASRSGMELLDAFVAFRYPNEIGPGVYDIHSPRVPGREEMEHLLRRAAQVLDPAQLWVNPDCGLKTRSYDEVTPSLRNLVAAARVLREEVGAEG